MTWAGAVRGAFFATTGRASVLERRHVTADRLVHHHGAVGRVLQWRQRVDDRRVGKFNRVGDFSFFFFNLTQSLSWFLQPLSGSSVFVPSDGGRSRRRASSSGGHRVIAESRRRLRARAGRVSGIASARYTCSISRKGFASQAPPPRVSCRAVGARSGTIWYRIDIFTAAIVI